MVCGDAPSKKLSSEMPLLSAAASTYGLNVEPIGGMAMVASLNWRAW